MNCSHRNTNRVATSQELVSSQRDLLNISQRETSSSRVPRMLRTTLWSTFKGCLLYVLVNSFPHIFYTVYFLRRCVRRAGISKFPFIFKWNNLNPFLKNWPSQGTNGAEGKCLKAQLMDETLGADISVSHKFQTLSHSWKNVSYVFASPKCIFQSFCCLLSPIPCYIFAMHA